MAIERLAIIGSRGHYGSVLAELAQMPAVRVVGLADGGDTVDPVAAWCREHGHATAAVRRPPRDARPRAPDAVVVCGPFERTPRCASMRSSAARTCIDRKARGVDADRTRHASAACERQPSVHVAGMMFSRYDPGFWTA